MEYSEECDIEVLQDWHTINAFEELAKLNTAIKNFFGLFFVSKMNEYWHVSKYNFRQRSGLCTGWELEIRLPVTAAQFIIKRSLFVQLPGIIRSMKPKLGFAKN